MTITNDDTGVVVGANTLVLVDMGGALTVSSNTLTITSPIHSISGSGTCHTISVSGGNPDEGTFVVFVPASGTTIVFSASGGNIAGSAPTVTAGVPITFYFNGTSWYGSSTTGNGFLSLVGSGSAFPATSGTAQSAGHIVRLKDASNAALDIGGNEANGMWLQAGNITALGTEYPILVNPNGGGVAIGTTAPTAGTALHVAGGGMALFGDWYNHVVLAIGYNNTTHALTETHQVGVYSALKANTNATGAGSFNAGFETSIGTLPGGQTLELLTHYAIGAVVKGAGSTITRTIGIKSVEETAGTNNAFIAPDGTSFTGNWFIYYDGTRASRLGGNLTLTGDLTMSGNSEIANDATANYIRVSGATAGVGGNIICFGSTHASANQIQINGSGGITLTGGDIIVGGSGEHYRSVNTGFQRIWGGTSAAGASLLLFGGTHATNANQAQITASGGLTITGTSVHTGVATFNTNVGIGTSTFGTSATTTLALFNGTVPSTSPADTVQLFSADISAGNASLGIRTETAVVTESVTSDRTLSVTINGTVYKICLKA